MCFFWPATWQSWSIFQLCLPRLDNIRNSGWWLPINRSGRLYLGRRTCRDLLLFVKAICHSVFNLGSARSPQQGRLRNRINRGFPKLLDLLLWYRNLQWPKSVWCLLASSNERWEHKGQRHPLQWICSQVCKRWRHSTVDSITVCGRC